MPGTGCLCCALRLYFARRWLSLCFTVFNSNNQQFYKARGAGIAKWFDCVAGAVSSRLHFKRLTMANFVLFSLVTLCLAISISHAALDTESWLQFAVPQYNILSTQVGLNQFPCTGQPTSDSWTYNEVGRWTVGFYAGSLWYLYKLTGDQKWSQLALAHQEAVRGRQMDNTTHDIGFIIHSTFGNALEFYDPSNEDFKSVVVTASRSLASRYHELAGCIRSWENDPAHGGVPGEVKVIADNMMNLELLFVGSRLSGDNTLATKAISHARQNVLNHMRSDGSSFHVVAYNETTGLIRRRYTHQGYSADSTWGRGQAWIIHGFASTYWYTGFAEFLQTAEEAAQWFIERLPEDSVPFWDFDVADFPNYQPRDTSAAACAASGLLQLYYMTTKTMYLEAAEKILTSLSSPKYRADGNPTYRIPSILVNGTQFYNENNMNTAIVYGDYYYLQAIDRYRTYVRN